MAARTKGWARTIAQTTATSAADGKLVASTDTSVTPSDAAVAAIGDRADAVVFLVAGVAQSIRWGGRDGFIAAGTVWGAGVAANTATWRCDVMYETTQTSVASDAPAGIAGAGGDTIDRTFSFTPAKTGTYRLVVSLVVTVTATGNAVTSANTDEGNFGSAAPTYLAGKSNQSFTPGLIAVGTSLSAPTHSPAGNGFTTSPRTTITNSFPFSVGSQGTDSSETCLLSWRNAADTQFGTTTIAAATAATKTDPGKAVNTTNFPIAATSIGLHLSFNNSLLSTSLSGSGIPWTFISGALPSGWSAVTSNSIGATEIKAAGLYTVDPRITFAQLLQLNDSAFGSPPLTKNNAAGQRLTSDLAFLAARATNANGAQVNGVVWTEKLWDTINLISSETSPWKSRTTTSQAQGGENGWSDAFMTWDAPLPGGAWSQKEVITTADLVGAELSNTRSLTLLAKNPNFQVMCDGGLNATPSLTHWSPGQALVLGAALVDGTIKQFVTVDFSPSPYCIVGMFNLADGKSYYLRASDLTFQPFASATADTFALTQSPTDSNAWLKTFTGANTTGWLNYNLQVLYVLYNSGTPYIMRSTVMSMGSANSHSGQAFDAIDFALNGNISFM